MSEDACTCDDPELVAVMDRNMVPVYVSGNKYCRYCLGCGRRYFCKKTFWERAKEKWVIPQGDDDPVPVEEFDDENFFECPECDHPHFGYPDECENCSQPYGWDEKAD
jgi:hypothetical protein